MNKSALALSTIIGLLFANHVHCQWAYAGGPSHVIAFAVSGHNVFAAAIDGVYMGTNIGTTAGAWVSTNNDLQQNTITSLAVNGSDIFVGEDGGGVILSTNNGVSWSRIYPPNLYVQALAVSGNSIFAGTYGGGVFVSTNNGASWTAIDSGLQGETLIYSLAVSGNSIYAGTGSGVFISNNDGTYWTAVDSGLTATNIYTLAASGNSVLASPNSGGIFISNNNGELWTQADSGWPVGQTTALGPIYRRVNSCVFIGNNIFASNVLGVYLSTNNGASWSSVNTGLPANTSVGALAITGNSIIAGTGNGVWSRPLSEMLSVIDQRQKIAPTQTSLHIGALGSLGYIAELIYTIRATCAVRIGLYTVAGERVAIIEDGIRTPGEYSVKFGNSKVHSGIYVCRFHAGSYQESTRIAVVN